jgi:hypothetical protein
MWLANNMKEHGQMVNSKIRVTADRLLKVKWGFLGVALAALLAPAPVQAATWYVSATAKARGDGSRGKPFASLAEVQQASKPGDIIMIEPAPVSVAPLDGGIVLKPGQKLIGDVRQCLGLRPL